MNTWYRLDHAANLFPAVPNKTSTSTFRVSMTLTEEVEPQLLQSALDTVIERFPALAVKLSSGIFWRFFSGNDNRLLVKEEKIYPCAPMVTSENNGYLLRVLYFGTRISAEFFHALTDGTGAMEFLKTLVYCYLDLKHGGLRDDEELVIPPNSFPSSSEAQDSFKEHYTAVKTEIKPQKALLIDGTRFSPYGHNIIHGLMSVAQVKEICKSSGVTVTAFLTAVLIWAINARTLPFNPHHSKPIIICVPVNLRKIFPSNTLRNFFAVVNIETVLTESTTFEGLLSEVSSQLKEKTTEEYLTAAIAGNMKYGRNIFSRFVPVKLKDFAIRFGFDRFSEDKKTMTLTNVGPVRIPDSMGQYVKSTDITLYPTMKSPINCGVSSYGDCLSITFIRNVVESGIIQTFFRLLSQRGLDVEVYSNDWGYTHE